MGSSFKFHALPQVAAAFLCSTTTVKRWVREGLLVPRYQVLSGRCYRLVFSEAELERFASENFPEPSDLDPMHTPRSSRKKAEMVRRLRNMHRLYLGKASAARAATGLAKEMGLGAAEVDPEDREEEPIIVDRGPRRPWDHEGPRSQGETPGEDQRSLGEDRESDRTLGEDRETQER